MGLLNLQQRVYYMKRARRQRDLDRVELARRGEEGGLPTYRETSRSCVLVRASSEPRTPADLSSGSLPRRSFSEQLHLTRSPTFRRLSASFTLFVDLLSPLLCLPPTLSTLLLLLSLECQAPPPMDQSFTEPKQRQQAVLSHQSTPMDRRSTLEPLVRISSSPTEVGFCKAL